MLQKRVTIQTNDRIFVCGMTGSGKTILAKNLLLPKYNRVVFHDHKIRNNDLLERGFLLVNTPDEMLAEFDRGNFKLLYQPITMSQDAYHDDFNRICEIIYKVQNIALFVDECSFYADAHNIEDYHAELLQRGRERGCGVVNLTQRPVGVHNLLLSEAQHFFVFTLSLKKDIEKLLAVLPRDMHKELYELKEFHYIYSGTNRIRRVCKPIRMV